MVVAGDIALAWMCLRHLGIAWIRDFVVLSYENSLEKYLVIT